MVPNKRMQGLRKDAQRMTDITENALTRVDKMVDLSSYMPTYDERKRVTAIRESLKNIQQELIFINRNIRNITHED